MRSTSILPRFALTAVLGCLIVKHGAADGSAIQATAATDAFLGISDVVGAEAGGTLDVHTTGPADVIYGGNVTRGDRLTSDANGRAVTAAPAAGATVEIIGRALVSGVAGDRGGVLIGRETYTRPA